MGKLYRNLLCSQFRMSGYCLNCIFIKTLYYSPSVYATDWPGKFSEWLVDPWLAHRHSTLQSSLEENEPNVQNGPCVLDHSHTIYDQLQGVYSSLSIFCLQNKHCLKGGKKEKLCNLIVIAQLVTYNFKKFYIK